MTYDVSEPFVRETFVGPRYDLIELSCSGDGLGMLALMMASQGGEPVYLVSSVYFDGDMRVRRYDGLGVDPPSVIERVDMDYYRDRFDEPVAE